MSARVAVIGAGVAGLACARVLTDGGCRVTVFDKGRSVGGRLATRRDPPHTFDLGAQYFTAKNARFVEQMRRWKAEGVCASWEGRIVALAHAGAELRPTEPVERFVGIPAMSALAKSMASGLDIRTSHRVDQITPYAGPDGSDGKIALKGAAGAAGVTLPPQHAPTAAGLAPFGSFDVCLVCLPSNQAAPLLDRASPSLASAARGMPLEPCFALGFVTPDDEGGDKLRALPFDGAFVGRDGAESGSALSWVARDSSKPGRPAGDRWVLHASGAWSRTWFDAPQADVERALLTDFASAFDLAPLEPTLRCFRRWTFARASETRVLGEGALFDGATRLGIAGDWSAGGKVEGAFVSGIALAERVLASFGPKS